ncbi:hypothetical protein [Mucilaginibacter flavus]|uniref:hypothetical protein n=1 Tax=Mucilaginibacter flavus TaxID=931504 RepID=UPI0025B401C8|nr:hypothetical protein [Mucilaginibacter flavus]MDN3580800.1 hypothetical protein [Mucilaginibacter flavus]
MKNFLCIVLFLFVITNARANDKPAMIKRYRQIIKLIQTDKAEELSKLVAYPLKRENPLKDITNAKEFIAYYPIMFDAAFKKKLAQFKDNSVLESNGSFGLVGGAFDGDIWLNEKGQIQSINYSSKREQDLKDQLTRSVESKMHPSVNHWDQNILVLQSPKLLIRLDRIGNNIRYVSWSKGRSTSEKPDIVLNNGTEEAQGTMGGWTYTFKSGDWTYVIDDVEMCESDDQCGYFLRLSFKGQDKSSTKLKSIK